MSEPLSGSGTAAALGGATVTGRTLTVTRAAR